MYEDVTGHIGEGDYSLYETLAKGGVGMIIVGNAAIDSSTVKGLRHLHIDDDKFIPEFLQLTGLIHQHGCPTFLQMGHMGPAQPQAITGTQPVASSSLKDEEKPSPAFDQSRELSIGEIEGIIRKFIEGAERARRGGFDGVEVHAAHPYLLNSFFSRAWNKRQDDYGCSTLESRARFAVEILRGIKKQVGKDFSVGIRFNGGEWGLEKGITAEESKEFGKIFQEAGADYLHISGFGYGPYYLANYPEQLLYPEPSEEVKDLARKVKRPGALVTRAELIKKVVSIPVIGVGRLDPQLGEWLIEKGKLDLIALGRRLMADPDLPNKVASGRLKDIRPCVACLDCGNCYDLHKPVVCRVNAALGREYEYAIKPANQKKKVVVAGGGPAGMEAARIAALRGHEVVLFAKDGLGGLLPLAALVKGTEIEDFPALVRYFKGQLVQSGVNIRLGQELNRSVVDQLKPEVVIVATGGKLTIPDIPGIEGQNVMTSEDLHRRVKTPLRLLGPRLLGWLTKFWMPVGKRVVILGGQIHGCEVAEFLVKRGRTVTLLEGSGKLGDGMIERNRGRLLKWLEKKGTTMMMGVHVEEITDRGVKISNQGREKRTIEADTVVVATPPVANTQLFESLKGRAPEIYLIGDSKEPRLILEAIADGARIGHAI
jgi:2,4-dienoyl-CoA reductase (NADPH2)